MRCALGTTVCIGLGACRYLAWFSIDHSRWPFCSLRVVSHPFIRLAIHPPPPLPPPLALTQNERAVTRTRRDVTRLDDVAARLGSLSEDHGAAQVLLDAVRADVSTLQSTAGLLLHQVR